MKYRTTQKAVKEGYTNKICVGYCALQTLLAYERETAYTTRREGWGADIYEITPNTAIITGYAPFGNIRPGYEICKKYETAAEKIKDDYSIPYETRKEKLHSLLMEFIQEVTQ
jgi:hypothetical protein